MRVLASLFVLCIGFGVIAQTATSDTNANGPQMAFAEAAFDFGDITQGDRVTHTFAYENTGNEPLIISDVKTTCGCTATNWDREPLAPGASGEITVNFNSRGKMGVQNKVVTITTNAKSSISRVKIVTNVLAPQPEGTEPN